MGWINEINKCQKSRDTAPLKRIVSQDFRGLAQHESVLKNLITLP